MAGGGIGHAFNETDIKTAFANAVATGADTLIHVSRVDIDLGTSLMCMMDCYATFDDVLTITPQAYTAIPAVDQYFRGHNPVIKGVYDLKKPFAEARISADDLPGSIKYTIRKSLFATQMQETPWYGKLGLLTEGRREAAKARLALPVQGPQS